MTKTIRHGILLIMLALAFALVFASLAFGQTMQNSLGFPGGF